MTREEAPDPPSSSVAQSSIKEAHVVIKATSEVCPPKSKTTQQAKE